MKKNLILFLIISTITIAQVNTESFRKDYDSVGFAGNLGLDFTALTGNTDLQLFSFNGRVNYNFGNSYSFFVFSSDIGWKDNQRFSNLALFHLRFVTGISKIMQLEAFTQYNFDKSRLLLNRELLGIGTRIKILTSDEIKLRFGFSGMMEFEEYNLPATSNHPATVKDFRFSSYLSLSYSISDNAKFLSTSYYQPLLKDFSDTKLITENSLETKIDDSFKLIMRFSARFDNFPPDGRKKLDTTTKVGITYDF